ncbi:MAG TPA: formyltransferase family protein, partial [Chthoniobacterales bacterium]|nr:formyltransferase family protein [Chthoniobacterales bacterium]
MKVVVAGQKRFGRDVLAQVIARGWEVVAVSCPPDADDKLWIEATNRSLTIIPSRDLKAATMPRGCDVIIAAHCHSFLSLKTRQRAELGALGYHPSLLPLHRGRSSIEWAVRFRERMTGGSVYWLNDVVDGGPIAAQDWCFIRPGDSAAKLWARDLAPMGLRLFARAFDDLERGVVVARPQDPELAT